MQIDISITSYIYVCDADCVHEYVSDHTALLHVVDEAPEASKKGSA